jgi:AcrR family transcriptional regulator
MAQQTRGDILRAARRLFAERGYAATSINDIADEAGVAIQTIYARLGSKRGMLLALIDVIDEEAGVGPLADEVMTARTPLAALRAGVRLTRSFQERCGDIIEALTTAAGAEPELSDAVAEGHRRHREGARIIIDHIQELEGLRRDVPPNERERCSRSAPATKRGESSSAATRLTGIRPKTGSSTRFPGRSSPARTRKVPTRTSRPMSLPLAAPTRVLRSAGRVLGRARGNMTSKQPRRK